MSTPRIKRTEFEDMLKKTVKIGGGKFLPHKMKKIVRGIYAKNSSLGTSGMSRVMAVKKINEAIKMGKEAGVKFKHTPSTTLGVKRAVKARIKEMKLGNAPEEGFMQKQRKDMTPAERRAADMLKNRNLRARGEETVSEMEAEKDKNTPKREALSRKATVFGSRGKVQASALKGKADTPTASIGQIGKKHSGPVSSINDIKNAKEEEPMDLPID